MLLVVVPHTQQPVDLQVVVVITPHHLLHSIEPYKILVVEVELLPYRLSLQVPVDLLVLPVWFSLHILPK